MARIQLQTNERGNATLSPIIDFQVRLAANKQVILIMRYVETIEQFDTGQWKQLQTIVPAKRALVIAATLKKAAKLILESDSASFLN
jgi:hypothetical protein